MGRLREMININKSRRQASGTKTNPANTLTGTSSLQKCEKMSCVPVSVLHCLQEFAQTHVHWVNSRYLINFLTDRIYIYIYIYTHTHIHMHRILGKNVNFNVKIHHASIIKL